MADNNPTIVPPAVRPITSEASPVTSSPVSFGGGRPKLGPRRQSRFTEEEMSARTPASSVSIPSFDVGAHGWEQHPAVRNFSNLSVMNSVNPNTAIHHIDSFEPEPSVASRHAPNEAQKQELRTAVRGLIRALNSVFHAVPCLILLNVMTVYLKSLRGDWVSQTSIQALILLILVILDNLLNILILVFIKRPWSNWKLTVRSLIGVLYLAEFFTYIGFGGKVFPSAYTYWNMPSSGSSVFVFVMIWWLAAWNILHPVICRYDRVKSFFSSSSKSSADAAPGGGHVNPMSRIRRPSCFSEQRPTSFNPRMSTAETEGTVSMVSLTWRRWVRTRSTHFSRDFDLESGVGQQQHQQQQQQQRSRRGTADDDGVPLPAPQSRGSAMSATDMTLKEHENDDDYDDDDTRSSGDYKRRLGLAELKEQRGGSSLAQTRSVSRLGEEKDKDEDDYDDVDEVEENEKKGGVVERVRAIKSLKEEE